MIYRTIPVILAVLLGLIIKKGSAQPIEEKEFHQKEAVVTVVAASQLDGLQQQTHEISFLPNQSVSKAAWNKLVGTVHTGCSGESHPSF